ncbi:MAG: UDP-N-acetylmuramoyl-tripeptide--D-alanyl-D-alanine ligase [Gallionellaceae bacterium]|jgi:UDP-N-acetylmuramoyl-tripeptide--D-alanyl-D-alanine ligase
MMLLSHLAQLLDARLVGKDAQFSDISTDSRKIKAGDLFIALRGDNFDGFEFVAGSIQLGAVAGLVNADSYAKSAAILAPESSILIVEDTRLALGKIAAHWRKQFNIPLVGITGSNGKTTVKEMLASILRAHTGAADFVLATQGNLNNDIGLPLTLLKLRATHRYAVIEMGMNHPGEIEYLTHLACPDVAVINNAGSAHLEGLGNVEAVARAKGEIFAGLGEHGIAVINADDDHADLWRELAAGHTVIDFALHQAAQLKAVWQPYQHGAEVKISFNNQAVEVKLQIPGAHNVRNALAATGAALALNIPLTTIAAALSEFSGVAGRLQRKTALRGAVLIDDTYNANPASLHAALEVLANEDGEKILVLGDMGELGADAAKLHADIGAEARQLGIQKIFALGDLSTYAVDEFGDGATHFKRLEDLLESLNQHLCVGSTVLVKGSRFMKMERVVHHCTALQ